MTQDHTPFLFPVDERSMTGGVWLSAMDTDEMDVSIAEVRFGCGEAEDLFGSDLDAIAARFCTAWNTHDALVEALEGIAMYFENSGAAINTRWNSIPAEARVAIVKSIRAALALAKGE